MTGLSADELAYMRETQAEHRPTEATLEARVRARDATGGSSYTYGAPEPVRVRLDAAKDAIPVALAARFDVAALTKVVTDLVDVRDGDRLTVTPTEVYEIVTDGDPDKWATAQVVYAVRQVWPARA